MDLALATKRESRDFGFRSWVKSCPLAGRNINSPRTRSHRQGADLRQRLRGPRRCRRSAAPYRSASRHRAIGDHLDGVRTPIVRAIDQDCAHAGERL
jgi:hypothetical protein